MNIVLASVVLIVAVGGSVATLRSASRDGYRRLPDR